MSVKCRVDHVAGLLEDETARCILLEAYEEPKSATDLTDSCRASKPTVYRRLADLERCEFLQAETKIEPDGNHHPVYRTNVRRVTFEVTDGGIGFTIDRDEPMADQFTRLVEGI